MSLTTTTARDILLASFEDMVVRMDEETLTASDAQTGIRYINWIMAELSVKGVDLGFTEISNIADEVTIPSGAFMALSHLLAFRLWPKYRTTEMSTAVRANAIAAVETMFQLGVTISATEYPSTLPTGSGNTYPGDSDDTFYPDLEATILDEQNGSISLEDSTGDSSVTPPAPPPTPIVTELLTAPDNFENAAWLGAATVTDGALVDSSAVAVEAKTQFCLLPSVVGVINSSVYVKKKTSGDPELLIAIGLNVGGTSYSDILGYPHMRTFFNAETGGHDDYYLDGSGPVTVDDAGDYWLVTFEFTESGRVTPTHAAITLMPAARDVTTRDTWPDATQTGSVDFSEPSLTIEG